MMKKQLEKQAKRHQKISLKTLFETDIKRVEKYSLQLGELYIDFSKQHIDEESFSVLLDWANEVDVTGWRKKLFAGEAINHTEKRAVLHMALRSFAPSGYVVNGEEIMDDVLAVREQCFEFASLIRNQTLLGVTGKPINTIVNIGIGGSDLGPKLVVNALERYQEKGLTAHFISRLGEDHFNAVLRQCNLEQTLFVVVSKTFTTLETMENAKLARKRCVQQLGEDAVEKHFVAVSNNTKATEQFGINPKHVFRFWDWVGGRYSVWSSVGLTAMIMIGKTNFIEFLKGAENIDQHFYSAPLEKNIPVILALLGAWYRSYWDFPANAILSYDENLALLTPYLQQLDMESNGKTVTRDGSPSDIATGPIIFGGLGNDGQHAYYQWFHQGSNKVSADFFAAATAEGKSQSYHAILLANCYAQSQALMLGRNEAETYVALQKKGLNEAEIEELLPYCVFEGDRPSTTFLYPRLTPRVLGMILALYEHKVFTQGILWNINSFDQWGVELGKELAQTILSALDNDEMLAELDGSTRELIERTKRLMATNLKEREKD